MIYSVRIDNGFGERLGLVLGNPIIRDDGSAAEKEDGILITEIGGLGPVKADIKMNESATSHGAKFNSARANTRDITFHFRFLDINGLTVEDSRLVIYKFFPLTEEVTIYIRTEHRYVKTSGYVESVEPDIFTDQAGLSVTVKCPDPWFHLVGVNKADKFEFSNLTDMFEFIFADEPTPSLIFTSLEPGKEHIINYSGEVRTGMIISIKSRSDNWYGPTIYVEVISMDPSESPVNNGWYEYVNGQYVLSKDLVIVSSKSYYIRQVKWREPTIYNNVTREKMTVNTNLIEYILNPESFLILDPYWEPPIGDCTIGDNDEIRISTVTGNKYIKFIRDGKSYNVLNALPLDTDWLTLTPGRNVFSYKCGKFSNNNSDGQYAINITMTADILVAGV